jgi:hypothetical protein
MKKSKSKENFFQENDIINVNQNGGSEQGRWEVGINYIKPENEQGEKGPDSIFGALKNLAQQTIQGATRIGNVIGEGAIEQVNKSGEALTKYGLFVVGKAVDTSIDTTLGDDIDNKSIEEMTQEATKKLQKVITILSDMAKDPEMKALLRKVGKIIGDLMKNTLETAREPLKKATVTAIDIGKDVGHETLAGATRFAVDMVSVVASEIPVLGGVVDLTIAIGRAFNSGMTAFKKGTGNTIMVAEIANKLISEVLPKIDTAVDDGIETKRKLQSISNRFINMINGTSNSVENVSTGIKDAAENIVKENKNQAGGSKSSHHKDIIVHMFNSTRKGKRNRKRKAKTRKGKR